MMGPVLLFGASSGIGAACAQALSAQGRAVVLVGRNLEKLEGVREKCQSTAYCFPYDLQNIEHIRTIFDFCRQKGLCLDGMVYSAGIDASYPVKGLNARMMEEVMRVNCIAFFEAGKCFANKRYSADRSKIVAISSIASLSCEKGMGLYSASKAALNVAVKTMAKEYVRRGILVNAVLPAAVMTPILLEKRRQMDLPCPENIEDAIRSMEQNPVPIWLDDNQPYGHITPGSVASMVSYLLSDENRYITGALIPISAGTVV